MHLCVQTSPTVMEVSHHLLKWALGQPLSIVFAQKVKL